MGESIFFFLQGIYFYKEMLGRKVSRERGKFQTVIVSNILFLDLDVCIQCIKIEFRLVQLFRE